MSYVIYIFWKDIADLYATNAGVGNRRSVLRWIKIGVCTGFGYLQIDMTYLRANNQTGTNFNDMKIIPDLRPRTGLWDAHLRRISGNDFIYLTFIAPLFDLLSNVRSLHIIQDNSNI